MKIRHCLSALALVSSTFAAHAGPVPVYSYPDPTTFAAQYGDFYSFSLPILSSASVGFSRASVNFGPGSPYYINTASVIQDALVVGTGAGGNQVNADLGLTGFVQKGYEFPNIAGIGVVNFDTVTAAEPGGTGNPAYDKAGTWDIQLSALRQYLTRGGVQYDLVAYFNNNQRKTSPALNNLWARAEVTLTDTDTNSTKTLLFNNPASGHGDYVLSGGPVTLCFNYTNPLNTGANDLRTEVPCAGPHTSTSTYEHNLGHNGVAYGLTSLDLNSILLDLNSAYDLMSVRVQFDDLNNGYEDLYIGAACINRQCGGGDIPEPGSLALLGLGLAALGLRRYRIA